jgi:hypothetical protein
MKRITQLIPVFVLAASSAVVSARAQDTPQSSPLFTVTTITADGEIDTTLLNLSDVVGDADAVVAQLEHLRALLARPAPGSLEPTPIEPDLAVVIEAVIASARRGFMTYFEAAFVREQVIEARLDRVLRVLEQRAKSTGWNEDDHMAVVAQLVQRARVAIDYPDAEAARARLEAILDDLRATAHMRAASFDAFRLELIRSRLVRYYQFLVKRARILGLTREEVHPYLKMVFERARLMAIVSPG